jgi:hypothetical protein
MEGHSGLGTLDIGSALSGLSTRVVAKIENGEITDVVRPPRPDNIALPPLADGII